MAQYKIRILDEARSQMRRLDSTVASRILKRLDWLALNFDSLSPQALTGQFAGSFKLRVGDYRAIYDVFHDDSEIVVRAVGHRRNIYRQ